MIHWDPAASRLLAGAVALGLLAAWTARERDLPRATESPAIPVGAQLAARGCIDPDVATAQDWRQVPGVTAKAAQALAEVCRTSRACAPCGPDEPVHGVGPVTLARIADVLCTKPGVNSQACPARTRRGEPAPPVP